MARLIRYRAATLSTEPGRGASAGRAAVRSGASFQDQVAQAGVVYARQGLAMLVEIPTATVGGQGGKGRRFVGKRGVIDFAGHVVGMPQSAAGAPQSGPATPLYLDAKVTTGAARFTLSFDDGRERDRIRRQVEFLVRAAAQGAIAGYLCLDRNVGPDGALFWLAAAVLAPLEDDPSTPIPIRTLTRRQGASVVTTPHPWVPMATMREMAAGRPAAPWLDLFRPTPDPGVL
jgi:hypothetical protein